MKREIKEGLLRRILPVFAILAIAMIVVRPEWDSKALGVGLVLAVMVGLILAVFLRRRIRAAGLPEGAPGGPPVRVTLEVRPVALLLWLAASIAIGFVAGAMEKRFGIDLREYGVVIVVPLVLLGFGLSLRPKPDRGD
jgi:hypothetical protein